MGRSSRVRLFPALDAIRARGFALQETMIAGGLRMLAAPVLDRNGFPVAGISVAQLMIRSSDAEFEARAVGPLLAAARDIARAIEASESTGLSSGEAV